jgi:hypothetical protein
MVYAPRAREIHQVAMNRAKVRETLRKTVDVHTEAVGRRVRQRV